MYWFIKYFYKHFMKKEKKIRFFSQLFIFIMKLVLKFFINNLLINALTRFQIKIKKRIYSTLGFVKVSLFK